jgi:hypothetical protein
MITKSYPLGSRWTLVIQVRDFRPPPYTVTVVEPDPNCDWKGCVWVLPDDPDVRNPDLKHGKYSVWADTDLEPNPT